MPAKNKGAAESETAADATAPEPTPAAGQGVDHVLTAIQYVQQRFSQEGLEKNRDNQQQHYKFRGIDDVYNKLSTFLVEAGLIILPHVRARETTERTTKQGGVLIYTTIEAEYEFVSSRDGSRWVVGPIHGEAMDSGDKSTNKAMSAAYKYLCLQTFCIPTEGDNDADGTTHEVAPRRQAPRQAPPEQPERQPAQRQQSGQQRQPAQAQQPTNGNGQRPARDLGPKKPVAFHLSAIKAAKTHEELRAAFGLAWKQYESPEGPGQITDAQLRFKDLYNERREQLIAPSEQAQQDAFDEAGGEADQQQGEMQQEAGASFWPDDA